MCTAASVQNSGQWKVHPDLNLPDLVLCTQLAHA